MGRLPPEAGLVRGRERLRERGKRKTMRAERGVAAVVNFFGGFLCGTQEIRNGGEKNFNHGWGVGGGIGVGEKD